MVYHKTPFEHLRNNMQKWQAITDPAYSIDFPTIRCHHTLEVLQVHNVPMYLMSLDCDCHILYTCSGVCKEIQRNARQSNSSSHILSSQLSPSHKPHPFILLSLSLFSVKIYYILQWYNNNVCNIIYLCMHVLCKFLAALVTLHSVCSHCN